MAPEEDDAHVVCDRRTKPAGNYGSACMVHRIVQLPEDPDASRASRPRQPRSRAWLAGENGNMEVAVGKIL
jgi:hypothetical protein